MAVSSGVGMSIHNVVLLLAIVLSVSAVLVSLSLILLSSEEEWGPIRSVADGVGRGMG